jgi:hypothetical protein
MSNTPTGKKPAYFADVIVLARSIDPAREARRLHVRQTRFEMAHGRRSQGCSGELRQAVLRVPHMHPSPADVLEGSSMRQLIQPSYDRLRGLTYIIRDHKAFSQFAFEMFTFGETA